MVNGSAVLAAKAECLDAFEALLPGCNYSFDMKGLYAYGCPWYLIYHFDSLVSARCE
jgi:hypothetical protein